MGKKESLNTIYQIVSILILLDSLLLYSLYSSMLIAKERFQSLFYWILFFYNVEGRLEKRSVWMFQSLFYWILFFYFSISFFKSEILSMFQSLFYWILFFYINIKVKLKLQEISFQSLFYWILFFYNRRNKLFQWISDKVSILILLDSLLLF